MLPSSTRTGWYDADCRRSQGLLSRLTLCRGLCSLTQRGQVGFVGQDPVLFNATIRDNITYGRSGTQQVNCFLCSVKSILFCWVLLGLLLFTAGVATQEVEAAAKAAYIHDFIVALRETRCPLLMPCLCAPFLADADVPC